MTEDTISFGKEDTLALKAMSKTLRAKEPEVARLPLGDMEEPEKFQGYDIVATTAHITGSLDSGWTAGGVESSSRRRTAWSSACGS